MSMINCPECGRPISDKAAACPYCNQRNEGVLTANVTCPECKMQYPKEDRACPACGCPNNTVCKKKHGKWIVITAIALCVVILSGLLGSFIINKGKAAAYYNNMETVTYKMIAGSVLAEDAGNLIKNVWYNTIFKKYDDETDKYTLENGVFVSDFNDALGNLFSDEEFKNVISGIKSNQNEVTELMKILKNPPKEYEEAYLALKAYYDDYLSLTKIVISPTGSLSSFSEDFNNADNASVKSYENMKMYLN